MLVGVAPADGLGRAEVVDVIDALHVEGDLAAAFGHGQDAVDTVFDAAEVDIGAVTYL